VAYARVQFTGWVDRHQAGSRREQELQQCDLRLRPGYTRGWFLREQRAAMHNVVSWFHPILFWRRTTWANERRLNA